MPRRARLYLPDQPQHIVVRGHNRDPVLARHEDFRFLYRVVRDAAQRYELSVHAWVFMHNHLHLLATPANASSLPRSMQSIGRRYAQYFNRTYHRSGALWEGRYKASLVDSERYLLTCYRYIELNPQRAGMTVSPGNYPYSSYPANGMGRADPLVTPHSVYLSLGATDADRLAAYNVLFEQALSRKTLTEIRRGTESGLGIGQGDFLLKVAKLYG